MILQTNDIIAEEFRFRHHLTMHQLWKISEIIHNGFRMNGVTRKYLQKALDKKVHYLQTNPVKQSSCQLIKILYNTIFLSEFSL